MEFNRLLSQAISFYGRIVKIIAKKNTKGSKINTNLYKLKIYLMKMI